MPSNWFEKFLDSLASRGGNLFILLMINVGLFAIVFHILHHNDNNAVAQMIMTTFSNFSGALLHAIVAGGDNNKITTLGLDQASNKKESL